MSVVGPVGDDFARSVARALADELGRDAVRAFEALPKTRWQAVRLRVWCASPDDFCAVHARFRALEGVKAVN